MYSTSSRYIRSHQQQQRHSNNRHISRGGTSLLDSQISKDLGQRERCFHHLFLVQVRNTAYNSHAASIEDRVHWNRHKRVGNHQHGMGARTVLAVALGGELSRNGWGSIPFVVSDLHVLIRTRIARLCVIHDICEPLRRCREAGATYTTIMANNPPQSRGLPLHRTLPSQAAPSP